MLLGALAGLALLCAWFIGNDDERPIYVGTSTPVITQLPHSLAIPTAHRRKHARSK